MEKRTGLAEIEDYVRQLFDTYNTASLCYHNLEHTRAVAAHTAEIAAHYQLEGDTLFALMAAAWFHDTGHLLGTIAGHEEASVRLMTAFFEDRGAGPAMTAQAASLIRATKMPVHPVTLPEKIIVDADSYHLGTEVFRQTDQLVRQELAARLSKRIDNWYVHTLRFLESHVFYTDYCRALLEEGKQRNIEYVKSLLENNPSS